MSIIDTLEAQSATMKTRLEAIVADADKRDSKALTPEESAEFDALSAEIRKNRDRAVELRADAVAEANAVATRKIAGVEGEQRVTPATVKDAPIYAKDKPDTSYFRDLFQARNMNDADAADRLRRNDKMVAEARALTTTAGAGGEFAPPEWMISDFVKLARVGRKFADSIGPQLLPAGISSVNIPKVSGGTTTAVQATNNATLSQTDMTTTSLTSGITTIGGKQVVSLQLLTQSGIPFDQVVLADLAGDYAKQFDNQVINGSAASGQLNGVYTYFNASGTVNTTYTQATPAVGGTGGLYSKIFAACSAIESARFMAPDTIWMHPRRWNWILSSSDSNNRPLVVPNGLQGFNVIGGDGGNMAEGAVGSMAGLNVVTDANIVTNLGAGTNQDPILVGVRSDLRLWESALQMESFTATYADSAGVLFRALAFSAAIPSRYTSSVSVINGTGTVVPAF